MNLLVPSYHSFSFFFSQVDRVVCAVATALRNLAIDQRNKELIGKYAMRDLIQKLPSGNNQHDQGTSDDTIAAVLATLNEVIKKNAEFSRSLLDAGGVDRLMNITRQRQKYTPRVLKFAGKRKRRKEKRQRKQKFIHLDRLI